MADFQVKFKEAIDFLQGKLPEVSLTSQDVVGPVHAKVFTVAGSTSADMVADLHDAMTRALDQGQSIGQFRKEFDQVVQRNGWTYNGTRGWRTRVIYDANMRSAHMAGRWAQLQANRANRPFLQYRTAGDARVRPLHRQWDGIVRHIDDDFWDTHYPPCGWGCRCTVRPYGQSELDAKGLKVDREPFPMVTRTVTDADGNVTDAVPVGIDPGWDHNVGKSWSQPEAALGRKIAALPSYLRGPFTDRAITPAFQKVLGERWTAFQSAVKASGKPRGEVQVLGFLDSAVINAIAARTGAELTSTAIGAADNKTSHLAGSHKAAGNPAQVWPQAWIDDLPAALRNYRAVLWDQINASLIVVPQGAFNARVPRVAIKQQATKAGTLWSVVSLGAVQIADLRDAKRFVVLVGALK